MAPNTPVEDAESNLVESYAQSSAGTPLEDAILGVPCVGFPTGVMESLCAGMGLIRERQGCVWGWLMIAVLTGDTWNLICYYILVPHIMGIHS